MTGSLNRNTAADWWRSAVIYQVYVRSLCDTSGDGVGDLPGITGKLDYFSELGVDAIWVTPFFQSPMDDFGYDVSDYRAVDPLFGSLADFDELLSEAHARGLRVIIDQVLSHTSNRHSWFEQSRSSRDNPYADWYVWAEPREDGSPPNNWLSIFGGPGWTWEPRRQQYYLHNFLESQPDLNFHNPAVQAQVLQEMEFWLERGVDGFRLDAINFCFHDRLLRDNPPKPVAERTGRGFSLDNPYAWQRHLYNNTQPEMVPFLERIRTLVNRYPGVVTLGEVSSEDSLATMAEYTAAGRLHMAYSFELLVDDYSGAHIRNTVEELERRLGEGWPCWSIGNHDVRRVLSRWGGPTPDIRQAIMLNNLLLSLKGSVCSYQGEELGLTEAHIDRSQVRDPYGLAFWPAFKGRDGCRTPIPWTAEPDAGFSAATPWLPVPDEHRAAAVAVQAQNDGSVLKAYQRMVRLRREVHALNAGDIRFIDTSEQALAFYRVTPGETLLCIFNLGAEPQEIALEIDRMDGLPSPAALTDITPVGINGGRLAGAQGPVALPAFGSFFARVV